MSLGGLDEGRRFRDWLWQKKSSSYTIPHSPNPPLLDSKNLYFFYGKEKQINAINHSFLPIARGKSISKESHNF
jgi:hypothetical protein